MQSAYVKLELNQPVSVALRYPTPTVVADNFNPQRTQLRWMLADNKSLYTPPEVRSQIEGKFRPGEVFSIEKRRGQRGFDWFVSRGGSQAAALIERAEPLDAPVPEPIRRTTNPLGSALKLAVEAVRDAEKHALDIGRPVQFSASDIERMAVSLLIGEQQRGKAA